MITTAEADNRSRPESAIHQQQLLRMTGVCKSFGRQRVLDEVDFDLAEGEVHILAGENGAGKSTLIKILGGVHHADEGQINLAGREVRPRSPREAASMGVAIIHQELSLIPAMSVVDNIFLGREISRSGWMRYRDQFRQAEELLGRMGLEVDIRRAVDELPISMQQMIEIAKALAYDARIIVMDEPTSALNEPEVQRLFSHIDDLKSRGCGIVYITHKLEEVYRLADRITVLRDGRKIATAGVDEMPADVLIKHMVGHELAEHPPEHRRIAGEVRLNVESCSVRSTRRGHPPTVDDVSFEVRKGEILGIGGVQGSGASDLLWALFGAHGERADAKVEIDGEAVRIKSPAKAIDLGMALLTNDRKHSGLVLGMDVSANATLASLPGISRGGFLNHQAELKMTSQSTESLHLRAASLQQPVSTLSGGNQQKVALAKWLNTEPRILLLDEPTRGVDIGAKREIYQLMNKWSEAGLAILLITSELPELLLMSDRIMVMHRGRTTAMFEHGEATAEKILNAAMGGET